MRNSKHQKLNGARSAKMPSASVLLVTAMLLLVSACAHDSTSVEATGSADSSNLTVMPTQCTPGVDCTLLGAAVVAEAISKSNSPKKDPVPGVGTGSVLIICERVTNEKGMEGPCPRSKITINFDSETKLELIRHGEEILIPGLTPNKPIDISISIKPCKKPVTFKGVMPGERKEVLFEYDCE